MNNAVYAIAEWDPDGAGPTAPRLAVGGAFTLAGEVSVNRVASYDPATGEWSALGSGMNDAIRALITLPNGDLVGGGDFTTAGGVAANRIARWDGIAWSPLGTGMDDSVRALTILPNGNLIAGGWFSTAGGTTVNCIARWDGTAWFSLGTGVTAESPHTVNGVWAITKLPNNDLVAGGHFDTAGGVPCKSVARWDGTAWHPLGSGTESYPVYALTMLPNGDLVAGGHFSMAGGVNCDRIARWDGSSWFPLGSGMSGGAVQALLVLPNGDLAAGGNFTTAGGVMCDCVARWDGAAWAPLGSGMVAPVGILSPGVFALTMQPTGDLTAGGNVWMPAEQESRYLAGLGVAWGDQTGDGHVNAEDSAAFMECVTGPDGGLLSGCDCADTDSDGAVDLKDFAEFQRRFEGP
ncbi:MAG: hypothetical protein JXB13_07135 [Phycisphaerae bacterium]|nr:hypothetical protein [Phycisphaerae bacterium]